MVCTITNYFIIYKCYNDILVLPLRAYTSHPEFDNTIALTVVNEWKISWTGYAFGIDIYEDGGTATVMFVDYLADKIHSLNPIIGGSAVPALILTLVISSAPE